MKKCEITDYPGEDAEKVNYKKIADDIAAWPDDPILAMLGRGDIDIQTYLEVTQGRNPLIQEDCVRDLPEWKAKITITLQDDLNPPITVERIAHSDFLGAALLTALFEDASMTARTEYYNKNRKLWGKTTS